MLRIVPNKHGRGAKSYFTDGLSREDYYTGNERVVGLWMGKAAEHLGLNGPVTRETFARLCDNRHPQTDERLTPRTKTNRRVAYDFNFHCPKTVSLLEALGDDPRVLEAFHGAVRDTMTDIEAEAQTRVRRGGVSTDRLSGNFVWAEFTHFTARPVRGVAEPQLHAHCFVFNVTFDPVEGVWKAAQFGDIKRDAPYFEALFLSRLAERLHGIGYDTESKGKFWEVARAPKGLVEKFSSRTAEIERTAAARGIDNPKDKADLGARTRKSKAEGLSGAALKEAWRSRLTAGERRWLDTARAGEPSARPKGIARDAVEHAVGRSFERAAVVPERVLLEDALRHSAGRVSVPEIREEMARRKMVTRSVNGELMVTTQEVLREEAAMVEVALAGRGRFSPWRAALPEIRGLNTEQLGAVNRVLTSSDLVTIIEGRAGTGKTTLIKAAVNEVQKTGDHSVVLLAPLARASRGVLKDEGFKSATTVARFLIDPELQAKAKRGLVWVDEAGLLGTRDARGLLETCGRISARLVLMGDSRQHGSVPRGSVLRVLREYAGVGSAWVEEIQRQRGEFKTAVECLSRGRVREGFERLDRLGMIKTPEAQPVARAAAEEYVKSLKPKSKVLLVAPTHAEGAEATGEVRSLLAAGGRLKRPRTFEKLTLVESLTRDRGQAGFYRKGQIVQFHQNVRGFRAGSRWQVVGLDPFGNVAVRDGLTLKALPLGKAEHFQVYDKSSIEVAIGDSVRITRNGKTHSVFDAVFNEATGMRRFPKRDLTNGSIQRVKRFTKDGDLHLDNGLIVPKDFGHIDYGYCVTSMGSQGANADRVVLLETKASGRAASPEQFYVSVSRAKESVAVFTDDKDALLRAVSNGSERLSALDLARSAGERSVERGIDAVREQERLRAERQERDRDARDRER